MEARRDETVREGHPAGSAADARVTTARESRERDRRFRREAPKWPAREHGRAEETAEWYSAKHESDAPLTSESDKSMRRCQ